MELLELVKIVDSQQNQANVQQQIDALKKVNQLDWLFATFLLVLIIVCFAVSLLLAWYQSWQLNKRVRKLEAKSEQRPISDYPLRSSET